MVELGDCEFEGVVCVDYGDLWICVGVLFGELSFFCEIWLGGMCEVEVVYLIFLCVLICCDLLLD